MLNHGKREVGLQQRSDTGGACGGRGKQARNKKGEGEERLNNKQHCNMRGRGKGVCSVLVKKVVEGGLEFAPLLLVCMERIHVARK